MGRDTLVEPHAQGHGCYHTWDSIGSYLNKGALVFSVLPREIAAEKICRHKTQCGIYSRLLIGHVAEFSERVEAGTEQSEQVGG